jgi:tetratricopeptide (TPR) repeat protein
MARVRVRSLPRGVAAACVALLVAACAGPEAQRAEHVAAGWKYIDASNFDKARVEFANALKIEARDAEARFGAGRAAEGLQDYRVALGHYQAAVDANPAETRSRVAMARLLFFGGLLDESERHVKEALAIDPRQAEALAVRGAIALARGDAAAARADVDQALAIDADSAYALSLSSSLYVRANEIDKAVAQLAAATQRRPDDLALRRVYAELSLQQNRPAEAVAQLREIVRLQPDVLAHRLQLAELHARLGDAASVEATLREAVAARPDDDDVKLALVDFLRGADRADDARATLEGFVEASPSNLALQVALGRLYRSLGKRADAERVLTGVIDASREGRQGLRARIELARLHVDAKDLDSASRRIEEVLAENALDAGALTLRATLALARGDHAAAIADLRSALRDAPDDKEMSRLLARAYVGNGDRALAAQTLEALVARAPEDVDSQLLLADLRQQDGKAAEAVAVLRAALGAHPADSRVAVRLVQALLATGDPEQASTLARALAARADTAPVGHYFVGFVAEAGKDLQAAEAAYRQSLELDARGAEPLSRLVALLLAGGRTDEARSHLQRALAQAPDHAVASQMLGEIEMQARAPELARPHFEAAIRAQPAWHLPYRALALLAQQQGDLAGARAAYERGIAATRGVHLQLDLAALELQRGDAARAMRVYREALAREPDAVDAVNNLAMLLVAPAAPAQADLDEALALARRLEGSGVPAHLDTLGWVHHRRGEQPLALQYLARAARLAQDDATIAYHLAAVQHALQQPDAARRSLDLALRDPDFADRAAAEALRATLN